MLFGHYDNKCDVWSIGVVLYVLLCGEAPFSGSKDGEILAKIKQGHFEFKCKIYHKLILQYF